MNKTEMADNLLRNIDVRYVEEVLESSPSPKTSSVRQFVRKPGVLAAAVLLVCLIAGGIFAAIYFRHQESPSEDPTELVVESTVPTAAPKQYKVTLISEGNAGEKTINMESDLSYSSFTSTTAPKELTVTFRGKEYTGTYWMSEKLLGSGIIRDEYHIDIDRRGFAQFEVNSTDHKLLSMHINARYDSIVAGTDFDAWELAQPVLSKEEIEALAVSYAKELVSLDEYSARLEIREGPTVIGPPSDTPEVEVYDCYFCSTVQGIETTDQVSVLITDRGTFYYAIALAPGWVGEHRDELLSFDVEAATEAAKEASHLTNPTVKVRRFGIDENGHVFLMLFITGSDTEMPLLLGVTEE